MKKKVHHLLKKESKGQGCCQFQHPNISDASMRISRSRRGKMDSEKYHSKIP